jgi:P-type Ca2+ transporter type 2C
MIILILVLSFTIAQNEYYKLQSFENHEKIKSIKYVNVIRNGLVEVIINHDILVGDILMLEPGDHIPADGICLRSNGKFTTMF